MVDAESLMPVMRAKVAELARRAPAGVHPDDLESVGNEALAEALRSLDLSDPTRVVAAVRVMVERRVIDYLRSNGPLTRRGRLRPASGLPVDPETGGAIAHADGRAADPCDIAAAREETMSAAVAAGKARRLRTAMFAGVSEADVAEVMAGVVGRAKKGNLAAARLFFTLLGGRPTGEAVAVTITDVD